MANSTDQTVGQKKTTEDTDKPSAYALTKDGVKLQVGMIVWVHDPHDHWVLKMCCVIEVYAYGPCLQIHNRPLVYHRNAVWSSREKAVKDGPPFHIYPRDRSRTGEGTLKLVGG